MKQIIGAQSKVAAELMYLETAAFPIRYVLASRTTNNLHKILKRELIELVIHVYIAQKESPTKGEWIHIIKEDMELPDINMRETNITTMLENLFKRQVTSVNTDTLRALRTLQDNPTKMKHIKYNGFRLQPYLQSERLNRKEASTPFNMRADRVNEIKKCFPKLFKEKKCLAA